MNDYSQNNNAPSDFPIIYQTQNYGGLGANFQGLFSAGYLQFQGSNDGLNWFPLLVADAQGNAILNNKIIAEGWYHVTPLNFSMVRVYPSTSDDGEAFDGRVKISADVSRRVNTSAIVMGG